MAPHVVLDANTIIKLHAAGKVDLLTELFGTVLMPSEVRNELLEGTKTKEWAANLPAWVQTKDPQQQDPKITEFNKSCDEREAKGDKNVPRIDAGEAAAISLAKEIAAEEGRPALVVSDEGLVREFLNAEGPNQQVFATNYWSIICQAAERGLVDLDKERPELERFNKPGSSEKHRDHVNELDVPTRSLTREEGYIERQDVGYTPKEKVDMMQTHLQELSQKHVHDHDQEM